MPKYVLAQIPFNDKHTLHSGNADSPMMAIIDSQKKLGLVLEHKEGTTYMSGNKVFELHFGLDKVQSFTRKLANWLNLPGRSPRNMK